MSDEKRARLKAFEEAAAPLMAWMKANCDPLQQCVVTQDNANLYIADMGVVRDKPFTESALIPIELKGAGP